MEKLNVFKIGGKVIDQEQLLSAFLTDFSKIEGKKLLIHGGGKIATDVSARLGIKAQMVDGRRVTSKETLDVVLMVYGGLVNKKIVAALQALKVNAIGLTGADLNVIKASRRPAEPVDYGYVGNVEEVNADMLQLLINQDVVPVMSPITHDQQGQIYNTNADTIAAATAGALSKFFDVTLYYCFEKKGVLLDPDKEDSLIKNVDFKYFNELQEQGIVAEGMIPKLQNAFKCLNAGVSNVYICNHQAIGNLKTIGESSTLINL